MRFYHSDVMGKNASQKMDIGQRAVMIDGVRVQPVGDLADELLAADGETLTLREGQTVGLVFPVPQRLGQGAFVDVTVVAEGYYVRTP